MWSSEFEIDTERLCRVHGHKWIRPNPLSSFWEQPENKHKRKCLRCKKWGDINPDDGKK